MATQPADDRAALGAQARRPMARLRGTCRESRPGRSDQGHHPDAWACRADGSMQEHGIPAAVVTKFLSARRIEIEKTGLYSFLVLFSMGDHQGQVEHAGHRADQLQGPVRRQCAAQARAAGVRRGASGRLRRRWACKDLCEPVHQVLSRGRSAEGAEGDVHRRCPRWRCGRPTPTSAWCADGSRASRSTSSWAASLAVMVVPYPPGIPADHAGRAHHRRDQVDP